ncbi:MAG TPA: hypothetical protein VF984_10565 [Actinomycetota bacterium]
MRRATLLLVPLMAAAAALIPATPVGAAFPSTNGIVAYRADRVGGQGDIFTVNPVNGQQAELTNTAEVQEMDPAWSPDGTRIAFTRRPKVTLRPDLFVMHANGRARVRLTATPVAERHPAWSPDSTTLVYAVRTDARSPTRLFTIRADGTGRSQLTFEGSGTYDDDPSWSPDGSKIAFDSNRDGGFPEIYVMNADGSNPIRLTTNHLVDADPTWSPDGTRIAFVRCCADGSSEIYEMNADGTGEINVTDTPDANESDPDWSPDGLQIVYAAVPTGGGPADVWVMNADGSARSVLVSGPAADLAPSWQPGLQ